MTTNRFDGGGELWRCTPHTDAFNSAPPTIPPTGSSGRAPNRCRSTDRQKNVRRQRPLSAQLDAKRRRRRRLEGIEDKKRLADVQSAQRPIPNGKQQRRRGGRSMTEHGRYARCGVGGGRGGLSALTRRRQSNQTGNQVRDGPSGGPARPARSTTTVHA